MQHVQTDVGCFIWGDYKKLAAESVLWMINKCWEWYTHMRMIHFNGKGPSCFTPTRCLNKNRKIRWHYISNQIPSLSTHNSSVFHDRSQHVLTAQANFIFIVHIHIADKSRQNWPHRLYTVRSEHWICTLTKLLSRPTPPNVLKR